jgi:hypothetical protein
MAFATLPLLGASVLDVVDADFQTDDTVGVGVLHPVGHASSPPFLHEFARANELVRRERAVHVTLALATTVFTADPVKEISIVEMRARDHHFRVCREAKSITPDTPDLSERLSPGVHRPHPPGRRWGGCLRRPGFLRCLQGFENQIGCIYAAGRDDEPSIAR